MTQFFAGEQKTAKAVMTNPTSKAFDYHAVLYMGIDRAAMAEADFRINAGQEKEISLPVTMPSPGVYPVHLGVFSGETLLNLIEAQELTILSPSVTLRVLGPYDDPARQWTGFYGAYVWDGVEPRRKGNYIYGMQGITEFSIDIKSKDFMLISDYISGGGVGYPRQSGPYLITVPNWEIYTWKPSTQELGVGATKLLISTSKSTVIFVPTMFRSYFQEDYPPGVSFPGNYYINATIIDSQLLSGVDIGHYLIGINMSFWGYIRYTRYDQTEAWVMNKIGEPVKADLRTTTWNSGTPGNTKIEFYLYNMREP